LKNEDSVILISINIYKGFLKFTCHVISQLTVLIFIWTGWENNGGCGMSRKVCVNISTCHWFAYLSVQNLNIFLIIMSKFLLQLKWFVNCLISAKFHQIYVFSHIFSDILHTGACLFEEVFWVSNCYILQISVYVAARPLYYCHYCSFLNGNKCVHMVFGKITYSLHFLHEIHRIVHDWACWPICVSINSYNAWPILYIIYPQIIILMNSEPLKLGLLLVVYTRQHL
jgi:hypothetical protein